MSTQSPTVTVRDIDMPFGRMVIFFIKLFLAMIPAMMAVYAVLAAMGIVLVMLLGGVGGLEELLRRFGVA